jgi:dynein heavy chain
MREGLKKIFAKYSQAYMQGGKKLAEKNKLERMIKDYPGQVLITSSSMSWTQDVELALIQYETTHNNAALRKVKQTYKKKVESYIEIVEKPGLSDRDRNKLEALITMEEHNREIIERLYNQKVQSSKSFDWLQQLRFEKDNDKEDNEKLYIKVKQTSCTFDYGYEY